MCVRASACVRACVLGVLVVEGVGGCLHSADSLAVSLSFKYSRDTNSIPQHCASISVRASLPLSLPPSLPLSLPFSHPRPVFFSSSSLSSGDQAAVL